MDFPSKWKTKETSETPTKAETFWDEAKKAHREFIIEFLAEAGDDYDSWEDFCNELITQNWSFVQGLCKQSFSNGVRVGRKQRRKR